MAELCYAVSDQPWRATESKPTMPLHNRVTPLNKIVAYPEHGLFMGNRGCLHNDNQQIVRQKCSLKRWIICLTSFKDRKRSLMAPRQYTES